MKRAYVTLVMCGETYVQGALVLARSLEASGSSADRVVMVDSEVGPKAREVLSSLFTVVHEVEGIAVEVKQRHQPRFSNTHYIRDGPSSWLRKIFTKFHMFGLTDYDVICWLDADMYATGCPDSLFTLKAPAGVCSYYSWEQDNDLHGHLVPREDVERSLTVPTSNSGDNVNMPYGIRGAVSVLKPCEETRARIFSDLRCMDEYGSSKLVVGPDEMYLTNLYIENWTHVHHKFVCPAWKTEEFKQRTGQDPVLLHFVTDKPWSNKNWPDFDQWRATARQLMQELPDSTPFFSSNVKHAIACSTSISEKASFQPCRATVGPWRPKWKQDEGDLHADRHRRVADRPGGHTLHPRDPLRRGQGMNLRGNHNESGQPWSKQHAREGSGTRTRHGTESNSSASRSDADRW